MIPPKKKFIFSPRKIFVFLAVLSILTLAFLLRVYFSYGIVFSSPLKYAGDDGIYHMRIVENELLGGHFPKRIYFDPYTNFPNGTYIHFAPLYDQLLTFSVWILTLGSPSQGAIDAIAPFYPPLLGILLVLVVYFLGRVLWNNAVGLIAASIAAISPNLIFRSLLGATDHHVAEVLFSSLAVLFLICLIKFQEENKSYTPLEVSQRVDSNQISSTVHKTSELLTGYTLKWWILTILTGLALGLYFLVWPGALLFLGLFFIFFLAYSLYQYFLARPFRPILVSGAVIFFVVLLILIPYLGHPNLTLSRLYNLRQIGFLVFGLVFFLVIWILGKIFPPKRIKPIYFLSLLLLTGLFLAGLAYLISPANFHFIITALLEINTSLSPHENARELTSEMRPLTIQGAIDGFFGFLFFSLLGLAILLCQFLKKHRATDLFLILWFLLTFIINGIFPTSIGQVRYMYYFGVVVALFSALFLWRALVFTWKGLKIIQERENKTSVLFSYALIGQLLTIFLILTFLLYPFPFNIAAPYPNNLPLIIRSTIASAKSVIQHPQDWYDTLKWLGENTPAPSLNYYALYEEPGSDPKTKKIMSYNYPPDVYGVLARWDVGHAITYYSQRPTVSNPFHQGIGKKKNGEVLELGDGIFFLETDEEKAINYLDQLRVRFLITDSNYAHPDLLFKQIIKWVEGELKGYADEDIGEGPSRFDNSMVARLHILDGRSTVTERKKEGKVLKFEIEPLSHFRLVFESATTDNSAFKEDIKMVKIFEYVKGAKIIGKGEKEITISTTIKTNQAREFVYQQEVIANNGYFEFIVPYSTLGEKGWASGQTRFSVFAKPYKLKIGDKEFDINISEEEVLEGKTIELKNID